MRHCKKCNVKLDIISNKCPLCNSEIDSKEEFSSSYPVINMVVSKSLFRKLVFFLACVISVAVLILNYALTPNIKWSLFVILQIFSSYYVFYNVLSGRKKVVKLLLSLNIIVSGLSIFWDIYTGFHGWSVNYVIPALCISYGMFMLILRLVRYYAFKENSSYIYLNICLEFLPIILVYMGYAKPNILIYLSMIFGILNLIMLLAFDGSNFKDDIVKKLHI